MRMFLVFLMDTEPTSSIAKPACSQKHTRAREQDPPHENARKTQEYYNSVFRKYMRRKGIRMRLTRSIA